MTNSSFSSQLVLGTSGVTAGTYGNGSSATQLTINADGIVTAGTTVPFTSINGGQISGFRNALHNGAMQIWQRGSSAVLTTGNANLAYVAPDRWGVSTQGVPGGTVAQSLVAPPGFQYSMQLGRTVGSVANGGAIQIGQALETANSIQFQGGTATFSFWMKCGSTYSGGGFAVNVFASTGGTDQALANYGTWSGLTYLVSTGATPSTTWTKFSYPMSVGTNVTQIGMFGYWIPTGTAGTDDNLYLTGFQLEPGPVATPFELRTIGEELRLCQRYFEKSFNLNTAPANNVGTNTGETHFIAAYSGTSVYNISWIPFEVTKRVANPTITTYNPTSGSAGNAYDYTSGTSTILTTYNNNYEQGYKIIAEANAAFGHHMGVHWTASADL